jgi:threonine synthase
MTTVDAPNVHNVAVDGTFDDCQDLVKAMFADEAFRDRHHLAAVNSINVARVLAQIVYYAHAWRCLGSVPFACSVPTGNFGNILAGWIGGQAGVGVTRLVVASNRNDILTRLVATGTMAVEGVVPTLSPSMDIQVSSNLERLLHELWGHDGAATAEGMATFRRTGSLTLTPDVHARLRETFAAARVDDDDTLRALASAWRDHGVLVDPHTAVGLAAAETALGHRPDLPVVVAATAAPAKFPDPVERATGVRPPLPPHLADLLTLPERITPLPAELAAVQAFVAGVAAPA